MGYRSTRISAAQTADDNHYCESQNMKVGALTLTATLTPGGAGKSARHVTCTRTVVGAADTPGTLVVVGTNLAGQTITETLTPGANGILVTGTKLFASVTSVTGAGWVIAEGNDTVIVGMDAIDAIAEGSGTLYGIYISVTAAGVITVKDAGGTLLNMPASAGVGWYDIPLTYSGYLEVDLGAASDVFVIHSGSTPTTWST